MKSTWKFPFWVQENDGTVTQLTWSFLLVNASLVADYFSHYSLPFPVLPAVNKNYPPRNPTGISIESQREYFCMDTPLTHPSVNVVISSRRDSGPQQTLEIHAETLLPLPGRPCSSERSDHNPWEWFQKGLTWGDADLAYFGILPAGDEDPEKCSCHTH